MLPEGACPGLHACAFCSECQMCQFFGISNESKRSRARFVRFVLLFVSTVFFPKASSMLGFSFRRLREERERMSGSGGRAVDGRELQK